MLVFLIKGQLDPDLWFDQFEEIDDTAEDAIRERLFLLVNEPLNRSPSPVASALILRVGGSLDSGGRAWEAGGHNSRGRKICRWSSCLERLGGMSWG